MRCAFCKQKIYIKGIVSRTDTCPKCNRDLRCCKQCKFYDSHAYNECKEIAAERIVDKERSNFCEYFILKGSVRQNLNRTQGAIMALEALFKK
ncbi:MAG: hypothetical protein J7L16_09245 [Deltaproteobacteria bacterium]|nr:hypothetical protein [Deltaproteobacteria bacterium]